MQLSKFKPTLMGTLVGGAVMLGATQVHAVSQVPVSVAGFCSAGAATEGISTGDVKFNGMAASNCYGVVGGNITGSGKFNGTPLLNALSWSTGWAYLDATGAPGAALNGINFTLSATTGSSGTWTLTGVDNSALLSFPITLDLAIGIKAGNEFAVWGFDDVLVDGSDSGTFNIAFKNGGGKIPDLSHMIAFGRISAVTPVPEANTYAMLLAGLGLVTFVVRRKRA